MEKLFFNYQNYQLKILAHARLCDFLLVVAAMPAKDEEKYIARLIIETQKYVDEVLVVDDGSDDFTAEIAKKMGANVVSHEKNLGIGMARQTIFRNARDMNADILVCLDADGQHDPKYIPNLIAPITNGESDVVIGSRKTREGMNEIPYYRRIGLNLINKIYRKAINLEIEDTQSGYFALSKKGIDSIIITEKGMGLGLEFYQTLKENGCKIIEVPIIIKYKGLRSSKYNPIRQGLALIEAFIRYMVEKRPLFLIGFPGSIFLVIGVFLISYVIWNYYTNYSLAIGSLGIGSLLIIIGMLLVISSIILYAFTRTIEKLQANT